MDLDDDQEALMLEEEDEEVQHGDGSRTKRGASKGFQRFNNYPEGDKFIIYVEYKSNIGS